MEAKHRQLLLRYRSELQADLESLDTLLGTLIEDGVLRPEHDYYKAICALASPAEQKPEFLDLLPKLGPRAFGSFIRGLRKVQPHLADLLDQKQSEMAIDNHGKLPPATPKSTLAQRVQQSLRKNYLRLAKQTTELDYGRTTRRSGLHDVYVTVSSLDFDELHEMRSRSSRGYRKEVERRTFAFRRADSKELALRRLLRFDDGQTSDSCLVIGPGGVGKTLLLQWLMVSWAEGSVEELSKFEFVIYVSGRDVRALKSDTAVGVLQAALKRYGFSDTELEEMGEYLSKNSSRLLVLLDSADEGGEAWSQSEGLEMLVQRRSLHDCSLIITSRPCSLAYDLLRWCELRYYIVGFSDEHLDELLVRRLGGDKGREVAELLKEESRIQLRELMKSTPLLANMVAKLATEGVDSLPLTMTHTYGAMSINMVHRQQLKTTPVSVHQRQVTQTACTDELADGVREMFTGLGQMALEGLKKRCFVFDKDEVRRRCGDLALEIGILEEFEYLSVQDGGVCCGVQFCHLSWQEWFAAYAVSLLPDEKQDEHIRACVDALGVGEEMELFWRFAAGHARGKQLEILMEALHATFSNQRLSWDVSKWHLFACSCLAEAVQQPLRSDQSEDGKVKRVQTAAAAVLPEKVDLTGMAMGVGEVKTLSVALEHAPHVSELKVVWCGLQAQHFGALGGAMTHVEQVRMNGNPGLHGAGLAALVQSTRKSEQLRSLYLGHCSLDAGDCTALDSFLSLTKLKFLSLLGNCLNSDGLASLRQYLINSQLETLWLSNNHLDGDAGRVVGDVIQNNYHLKELHVNNNDLGNTGVEKIMEGVAKSNSLQHLSLIRTAIDDDILPCLSSTVTCRGQEQMLSDSTACPLTICLHGNNIRQVALQQLADQLPANCRDRLESDSTVIEHGKLHQRDYSVLFNKYTENGSEGDLDLRYKGVDGSGAVQVSSLLTEERYCVEVLDLGCNSIGNEGAVTLAGALQINTSLQGLSLNNNTIGAAGSSALAMSLTMNKSLLFLELYGNPLSSCTSTAMCEEQASLHNLISNCNGLRFIGLGFTALGDDGCTHVGKALSAHHGNLLFLNLSENEISDEGAAVLCCGLARNSTLKFMDLSSNKITRKGVQTIRQCLQSRQERGSPLQRVWMGGNPVTADDMKESMVMTEFTYWSITDCIQQYLQPNDSSSLEVDKPALSVTQPSMSSSELSPQQSSLTDPRSVEEDKPVELVAPNQARASAGEVSPQQSSFTGAVKRSRSESEAPQAKRHPGQGKGIELNSGSAVLYEISMHFDQHSAYYLAAILLENICPGGGNGFINRYMSSFGLPDWSLMAFKVLTEWCEKSQAGVFGADLLKVLEKVRPVTARQFEKKLLGIAT